MISADPPRAAERLLKRMIPEEEIFEKAGDLAERFRDRVREKGPRRARFWYVREVLGFVPFHLKNSIFWSAIMFKNTMKIAFRNMRKHRGYSFINIAGLALGMSCCILILAWARDEMSVDRFHAKTDRIYLVRTTQRYGRETVTGDGSVPALGPALKAEFPEVRAAARLLNGPRTCVLDVGPRHFREPVQLADPQIFDVFTFPLIRGDVRDAFSGPDVMILSEGAARRLFGGDDPINKSVQIDKTDQFRVVGVMKDMPANSTIRFDIWIPLDVSRKWFRPDYTRTWYNMGFRTYLELAPGVDAAAFDARISDRIQRATGQAVLKPKLYPFKNVYLELRGRRESVRFFSIIAFLILFIACINFVNLTTARSARRSKEVGLRKVVGADRRQVMRQFFGESAVFTLVALVLCFGLIALVLPGFRTMTAKTIALKDFFRPGLLAGIFGVTILTGLLAGSYPAFLFAAFKPAAILKGGFGSRPRGKSFRKVLVIIQFSLSIVLIIGTTVITNQIRFMKSKSLGFDREHLLSIPFEGDLTKTADAFKQELLRFPGIRSASVTTHSPTGIYSNGHDWNWPGRDPQVNPLVTLFGVDPDFLETFQMTLVRGKTFSKATPSLSKILINERFAEIIGSPDVAGMTLTWGSEKFEVLGVVKNYYFKPLTEELGPIVMYYDPTYRQVRPYRYMFIRLRPGDVRAAVAFIERTVRKFNPDYPFEFHFLDDEYDHLYRSVEREMAIVLTFAGLAVFISCLGLFGLAAYTAEQRTKEIGIRKVLGATVPGVMALLSREYAKGVLIANLIAWPVSYTLMKGWLKDFPYRTPLSLTIFVGAAVAALAIALLTVSIQAFKAARTAPVESIRYE